MSLIHKGNNQAALNGSEMGIRTSIPEMLAPIGLDKEKILALSVDEFLEWCILMEEDDIIKKLKQMQISFFIHRDMRICTRIQDLVRRTVLEDAIPL